MPIVRSFATDVEERNMNPKSTFGQTLRECRLKRNLTLRKFAEMAGVSPTYVSQVEQGNVDPPTAERVKTMADLLGANSDEWIALADRVPDDLPGIIKGRPNEMPELLREANNLTPEHIQDILRRMRRFNGKSGPRPARGGQ